MNIKELKQQELNSKQSFNARVTRLNIGETKSQKSFLRFSGEDATGNINVVKWDATELDKELYKDGAIVEISGEYGLYNDNPNFTADSMKLIEGEIDESLYYRTAPADINKMVAYLESVIQKIETPNVKKIVETMYNNNKEAFMIAPAASLNHHDYRRGLIYHTCSMLNIAEKLYSMYKSIVNFDIVMGSIILHDMFKTKEFDDFDNKTRGFQGNLIGHIPMAANWIFKTATELGIDEQDPEVIQLMHVVLAHHGKLEYGSPVAPQTPEAIYVHVVDNIDATMEMLKKNLQDVELMGQSQKIFGLGNRKFYKTK